MLTLASTVLVQPRSAPMALSLVPDPSAFSPLTTARLTLRSFEPADAGSLHRLVNDWAVVRMLSRLPFPYPRTLADEWIASAMRQVDSGTGYALAITGTENGQETLIGCVGLRIEGQTGHLGYWVGRAYWRHGVATEAAGRLARWALANLDLDGLEATVAADNPASATVLDRIGFRRVGTGREAFLARGGEHTVVRFAAGRDDLFQEPVGPAATIHVLSDENQPRPAAPSKPLVLVAACALIDADGRILLARRPEGRSMAGLWEFPGGKLNPGETPEAALIRELREELGIDVSVSCLAAFAFASHAYDKFHLLMPLYLCRRWTGRPVAREGQALAWVRPGQLTEYRMPPADLPLIPLLRDFL